MTEIEFLAVLSPHPTSTPGPYPPVSRRAPQHAKRLLSSSWTCALTVLLMPVVWQGPVPWCHCHGTLANCSQGSVGWLAAHLRTRHPGMELFGDMRLGWHFHASLPGSSEDDPVQKAPTGTDRIVPTSSAAGIAELVANGAKVSCILPGLASLTDRTERQVRDSLAESSCGHFYDSFAPTLALPLRFSVIRS